MSAPRRLRRSGPVGRRCWRWASFAVIGVLSAAGALVGCGSSTAAPPGNRVQGDRLSIYVSLPDIGPSAPGGGAALGGARMALAAIGGRIGRFRIRLRALDDATPARRGWDPGQTTVGARLAIRDPTTIGYVGDLDSGATAVALPLLSRAGIPQISPTSTAVGLTEGGAEASPGEPQKYYPTGRRTFARVIPNDSVQAAVQVRLQRDAGCHGTYVLDDGEVDGNDAAMSFQAAAAAAHLTIAGSDQYDPRTGTYTSLAHAIEQRHADCVLIGAATQDSAVALTDEIAAALPSAKLFATAGLAQTAYVDPAHGGITPAAAARMTITVPTLDAAAYPPAGRRFLVAYARRFGDWSPDSIYGYAAMTLMLQSIARATDHGRRAAVRSRVTQAIFATRDRSSVLGDYTIDRRGDTSLDAYGVYRIQGGRLVFVRAMVG